MARGSPDRPTAEELDREARIIQAEIDALRATLIERDARRASIQSLRHSRIEAALQAKRPSIEERRAAIRHRSQAEAATILTDETVLSFASRLQIPGSMVGELRALIHWLLAWEIEYRAPEYAAARRLRLAKKDAARLVKAGDAFLAALKKVPLSLRARPSLGYHVEAEIKPHRNGRRGRPRQMDDCPRYAEFARVFIDDIVRMGGKLTLTRSRGTGSLVWALDELRKLFPSGFIPDDLRLKLLEDYLREAKRTVKKTVPKVAPDSWVVPPTEEMRH
jgi:hypothetical protein